MTPPSKAVTRKQSSHTAELLCGGQRKSLLICVAFPALDLVNLAIHLSLSFVYMHAHMHTCQNGTSYLSVTASSGQSISSLDSNAATTINHCITFLKVVRRAAIQSYDFCSKLQHVQTRAALPQHISTSHRSL